MEIQRYTKKQIIDELIAEVTKGMFTGDNRDGDTPAITFENFTTEIYRYGAKALRARLSRLSHAKLWCELVAAAATIKGREEYFRQSLALLESNDRENATRAFRERQAEFGRKHGLQLAILAAARHYRGLNKNAKEAWRAIRQKPYRAGSETVAIAAEEDQEIMCVRSQGGKQRRSGIKFEYWQSRYWPAAKPGANSR
jgi:hypothetical protein